MASRSYDGPGSVEPRPAGRSLDVRIVGGGFAGTVTALTLLNGDHAVDCNVTLYEREASPYTTLCGEGLSDDTLRFFKAFDSRPHVAETFEEVSWLFPKDVEARVHQRGHTMARETWIPAMAQECEALGAHYRTGVKVTPDMVRDMAKEADVVIGADGPGSVTRKVVGGHHETMLGIQYRVERTGRVPERLEFVTDKRYSPEYAWVFPRGGIQNVGLLATGDGHDWERLDQFMKDRQVTGKVLKREAYPIGFFGDKFQSDAGRTDGSSAPARPAAGGGNVVLVGDAAGLTNPITKGGMAAVVHAADVLARCLKEGKLHEYEARLRRHPLTERSFRPALEALRGWSNEDFARLTRYAPKVIDVRPDRSTERAYLGTLLKTAATNLGKVPDILSVVRALGVSRRYSW